MPDAGEIPARGGRPFFRNAYALILNTGISGGLGLVFWFLAARYYDDSDVGRGSAAVSALMMLAGLVAVNAAGTLNRFIPNAGKRSFAVVGWAFALTSAAIAILALGFLATLDWWGPSFDLLRGPGMWLWFCIAAVGVSVVTVQESVLTALRASVWVPAANAVFGVGKVLLLVVLAGFLPDSGVMFSWFVPMLVISIPMTLLIFGRLLPRHMRRTTPAAVVSRAEIGRFLAADYVGALFLFVTIFLVPVLVATRVEAHTYAYFFVAWSIAGVMGVVGVSVATSLAVEGVYDAPSLASNCRSALSRSVGLLLVGAVAVSLAAPYALGLLGEGYLDAVPLLQLLVFASLPRAVVDIYIGTLRAQGKCAQITWVQALRGVLVLGLAAMFIYFDRLFGLSTITAVGVAVLVGQLAAMLVAVPGLGRLLGWRRETASAATVPEATDDYLPALAARR
jgi:O-antigen/teichoic acid export membrane protein